MNTRSFSDLYTRLQHKLLFYTRVLEINTKSNSFATQNPSNSIQRIYVINLDRKPDRWKQISRELKRIRSWSGEALFSITRRFSAIDARYLTKESYNDVLKPEYSLADQLQVEPNPRVDIDAKSQVHRISMSPQEIAIALSHIQIWKLIASSKVPYTLVLEDDVYFRRNFSRSIDKLWSQVVGQSPKEMVFDLLFLSFQEVGVSSSPNRVPAKSAHKPDWGIWQASGYVLSQRGAEKLIKLLPAYGPIDLWLNLQFEKLDVLIAHQSIIEQQVDVPSTNYYSVMPVLSQIGIYTAEKPFVPQSKKLVGPVFAFGNPGTGLTALAKALSMLGYTCCSDIVQLPSSEQNKLLNGKRTTTFNAYVNVGSLNLDLLTKLAKTYPKARFIFTTYPKHQVSSVFQNREIHLPNDYKDKWEILSKFLNCEYPSFSYPVCDDIGQRGIEFSRNPIKNSLPFRNLKFDSSPWIAPSKDWQGIFINETQQNNHFDKKVIVGIDNHRINDKYWKLRDDTFPSNLALFSPNNLNIDNSGILNLTLRNQGSPVRAFNSGAIVTRQTYLYGKFSVKIRPSNIAGLVTGVFLHRNSPHQEIDIEFLGKDTTRMLINVFYNPGINGTKLEYGYRGTPTLIELGFDAAKDFHTYEIEWKANMLSWLVDGQIIHQRTLWNPTPIPDLPMEFNVTLWYPRSKELAGNLDPSRIPSTTKIKSICVIQ